MFRRPPWVAVPLLLAALSTAACSGAAQTPSPTAPSTAATVDAGTEGVDPEVTAALTAAGATSALSVTRVHGTTFVTVVKGDRMPVYGVTRGAVTRLSDTKDPIASDLVAMTPSTIPTAAIQRALTLAMTCSSGEHRGWTIELTAARAPLVNVFCAAPGSTSNARLVQVLDGHRLEASSFTDALTVTGLTAVLREGAASAAAGRLTRLELTAAAGGRPATVTFTLPYHRSAFGRGMAGVAIRRPLAITPTSFYGFGGVAPDPAPPVTEQTFTIDELDAGALAASMKTARSKLGVPPDEWASAAIARLPGNPRLQLYVTARNTAWVFVPLG